MVQKKLKTFRINKEEKKSNCVLMDERKESVRGLLAGGILVLFLALAERKLLHFPVLLQKNVKNDYRTA